MTKRPLVGYAAGALMLVLCFFLSLNETPKIEGGLRLCFHGGLGLYALVAVVFLVEALQRTRFRPPTGVQGLYVYTGLMLGTIGILNTVLVAPLGDKGLFVPWLITLALLFYFRRLFLPLHLPSRDLVKNLTVGAGILLVLKLVVLLGVFSELPALRNYMSADKPLIGVNDIGAMSMLWLVGVTSYGAGLFLVLRTIREQNEEILEEAKRRLGLTNQDMIMIGIDHESLLGKSDQQIKDAVMARIRAIVEARRSFNKLRDAASVADREDTPWLADAAGLLDEKTGAST